MSVIEFIMIVEEYLSQSKSMKQNDFSVLHGDLKREWRKSDSCRLEIGKKVEEGETSKVLFNLTITDLIPIIF